MTIRQRLAFAFTIALWSGSAALALQRSPDERGGDQEVAAARLLQESADPKIFDWERSMPQPWIVVRWHKTADPAGDAAVWAAIWRDELASRVPERRLRAIVAVARQRALDESELRTLLAALNDADEKTVVEIGRAMGSLCPAAARQVAPTLVKRLGKRQQVTVYMLSEIGAPAVPAIVRGLSEEKDPEIRNQLLHIMRDMGPAGAEAAAAADAAPLIATLLNDQQTANEAREMLAMIKTYQPRSGRSAGQARDSGRPAQAATRNTTTTTAPVIDVATLVCAIDSPTPVERTKAALALWRAADVEAARAAAPSLRKALADPSPSVQTAAALALSHLGTTSADVVALDQALRRPPEPAMGQALVDPGFAYAKYMAFITALAAVDKDGLPALRKLAKDPEQVVRSAAVSALGNARDGQNENALIVVNALADPSDEVRRAAVRGLWSLRPLAPPVVQAMRRQLNNPDHSVREWAALAIAASGDRSDETLRALVRALPKARHDEFAVKLTLGNWGPAAIGELIIGLKDPSAIDVLAGIGRPAVPALALTLSDADPDRRANAATALARIGLLSREAAPALEAALSDSDPRVRREVISALGKIGPAARAAVPAIAAILRQPEWRPKPSAASNGLHITAIVALAEICSARDAAADEAAIEALVLVLTWQNQPSRMAAVEALGRIGPAGRAAAEPALLDLLDWYVQRRYRDLGLYAWPERPSDEIAAIAKALRQIDSTSHRTIPLLTQLLEREGRDVVQAVARSLEDWGALAAPAVPALVKALQGPATCPEIARALASMGPQAARDAVPALAGAMTHRDQYVRKAARDALEALGPPADERAIPGYLAVLRTPRSEWASQEVHYADATKWLGEIGPAAGAAGAGPILVDLMEGPCGGTVWDALARIGGVDDVQFARITAMLENEHSWVQSNAVRALARLAPSDPRALTALREFVNAHGSVPIGRTAQEALRAVSIPTPATTQRRPSPNGGG